MKKFMLVVFVLLFALIPCLNAEEKEYDFRRANWGMDKAQVKKSEIYDENKSKLIYEDLIWLFYKSRIMQFKCFILYDFIDNALYSAKYVILERHSNKNDYIADYEKLRKALIIKYGKSKQDTIIWKNELYKDKCINLGFTISIGHLIYISQWKTKNTIVTLTLTGDDYKIALKLDYHSRNFSYFLFEENKKEIENDL